METAPPSLPGGRIISSSSSRSQFDTKGEQPQDAQERQVESDDTLLACLQVLGAFFLLVNSWYYCPSASQFNSYLSAFRGVTNAFGAYQTYYEANLLKSQTPSQISWIGSIQAFLLLFVGGLITGPIFDAGYLRSLVIIGTIASVLGMMMTSLCKEYWQVILSQGVCVGIGAGCLFLPSVAVMPQYFTKRRAFATGIAAVGSSIGMWAEG